MLKRKIGGIEFIIEIMPSNRVLFPFRRKTALPSAIFARDGDREESREDNKLPFSANNPVAGREFNRLSISQRSYVSLRYCQTLTFAIVKALVKSGGDRRRE